MSKYSALNVSLKLPLSPVVQGGADERLLGEPVYGRGFERNRGAPYGCHIWRSALQAPAIEPGGVLEAGPGGFARFEAASSGASHSFDRRTPPCEVPPHGWSVASQPPVISRGLIPARSRSLCGSCDTPQVLCQYGRSRSVAGAKILSEAGCSSVKILQDGIDGLAKVDSTISPYPKYTPAFKF